MSVFRIYPEKSNTLASGLYKNYNAGQNAVTDLWYGGGGTDTAPDKRNSYTRFIVKFDLSDLQNKINSKEIIQSRVVSFRLKMKNCIPTDKKLEPEYEFDVLSKNIASSYDLICFPINKSWDQGRGYDLTREFYVAKSLGENPLVTGCSNWQYATTTTMWDGDGVYLDPTGYTYSGSVIQSGMTLTTALINTKIYSPTVFGFITSASTTASTTNISATTIGNNTYVSYNPLSGDISTESWYYSLLSTSFSGFGISIAEYSPLVFINSGYTEFYLSANTSVDNISLYSSQHFDIGNEDIDMDITSIVNDWLNGGSVNNGLGIAFRRDYELMSTSTRSIASFFTNNTNTAFKPFIEVVYDQSFVDDRLNMSNNRTGRLFLYTFSGNDTVNYFSASTVTIRSSGNAIVYSGLTPTQIGKGVYYVDVLMSGASRGQQYKDIWEGVTFVPGVDKQDYSQYFTIQDNYYFRNAPQVNSYSLVTYGIDNDSIISTEENIRIYCDLRVNFSTNAPKTNYAIEYRMLMNYQDEVIPWTTINQAAIDRCPSNYFDLQTNWLLHNQTYEIQFRVKELGTARIQNEKIKFKVQRKF